MLSTIYTVATLAAVASAASLGNSTEHSLEHSVGRRSFPKVYEAYGARFRTNYKCYANGESSPYVVRIRPKMVAHSHQHTSSYCGGYSSPALHHADCPAWGNWESSGCFLNLFKECNSRSDCKGVNYKASPGDGFSLRVNNPVALPAGSTFEWCNVMDNYDEVYEYECDSDNNFSGLENWVKCSDFCHNSWSFWPKTRSACIYEGNGNCN